MKHLVFILICTFCVFTSCFHHTQTTDSRIAEKTDVSPFSFGEMVTAPGKNCMIIHEDQNSNLWFASWESGLYVFDGKQTYHFTTVQGLPSNRVDEIREDKSGRLYFNTSEGVCRLEGTQFILIPEKESEDWQLSQDDLWFKAPKYGASVYRYDGNELLRLKLPAVSAGEKWMSDHPAYISPYDIYTIYRDSHGNMWFGTGAIGACRFDGTNFDWIHEEDVTELHDGPSNGIRSIAEDRDGYFWFNSAYRYNIYNIESPGVHRFYQREKSIGNLDGRPDSDLWEYMSAVQDDNQHLWIATYGSGVWKYDGVKTTNYPVTDNGEEITLFSIYKDRKGNLWLGTHEHGPYKFDGAEFKPFKP